MEFLTPIIVLMSLLTPHPGATDSIPTALKRK